MSRPYPTVFVGDVFETTNAPVIIKAYGGHHKVTVEFQDGTQVDVRVGHLRDGNVKNPNRPHIYGVGYMGVGGYTPTVDKKISREYELWRGMVRRCYDQDFLLKRPTYQGCSVCDEWLNFQTFASFFHSYEYNGDNWELDKDLLVKGNKVYSPDTCVIIPPELNKLLLKSNSKRGETPIGVCYNKQSKKYGAYVQQKGSSVFLGYHLTAELAFNAYKVAKEYFIKEQANKWRAQIDPRAYDALMAYEVSITD